MRLEPTVNVCLEDEHGIHYTPLSEIKNINSFNFASQAIDFEIARQTQEFEKTGIEKSATNKTTRGYDAVKKITFLQRTKEEAKDYRYFPEPDIPPFVIENELVERLRRELPFLPDEQVLELVNLGIDKKDAKILVGFHQPAITAVKLMAKRQNVDIRKLASLIVNKKIEYSKDAVNQVYDQYLKLTKVGNTNVEELKTVVEKIIADNPKIVAEYKKGKTNVAGFFVGQAMKETRGTADPKTLNKLILNLLNA